MLSSLVILLSTTAAPCAKQDTPIQDNSFLVEEAYNQEPGVVHHIGTFTRLSGSGAWGFSYTEEWPVLGQTHQASVTLGYLGAERTGTGVGDVALNYRWQAIGSGDAVLALSPRVSALLPAGDATRGRGTGGTGVQVNLPLSVALSSRFVTHVNLGGTLVPSALASDGGRERLTALALGQGLVWLAHRRFNVLAEVLYTRTDVAGGTRTDRVETLTVNPGLRAGLDLAGGLQIVPGVSVPIGVGPSRGDRAIFLYLSFEHPFRVAGPTAEPACGDGRG